MARGRINLKVLFVTTSETGSGEAITALHMAEMIAAKQASFHFLSSIFTAQFFPKTLRPHMTVFTPIRAKNEKIWHDVVTKFRPNAVLFADYPLLFFSRGSVPLVSDRWVRSLERLDAAILTLDHLGYAQRPMSISFVPSHLSIHCETMPVLPKGMQILLPCPIHEPAVVPGRNGTPFSYWHLPLRLSNGQRQQVRRRFLKDKREFLIFHSAPTWAWKIAERFGLPYYSFLGEILQHYLTGLPRPATVISVNNGRLLNPCKHGETHILNLGSVQKDKYERLLLASDLMLTENMVSASLGKAICGMVPCAVLCNQYRIGELNNMVKDETLQRILRRMESIRLGSIYPYEVFPIWGQQDLIQLGVFRDNIFKEAFARIEVFGDEITRNQLLSLLTDSRTRTVLRAKQRRYLEELSALPDAFKVLHELVG